MRMAALKAMEATDSSIVAEVRDDEKLMSVAMRKLPAVSANERIFSALLHDERWAIRSVAAKKLRELGYPAPAPATAQEDLPEFASLNPGARVALAKLFLRLDGKAPDKKRMGYEPGVKDR